MPILLLWEDYIFRPEGWKIVLGKCNSLSLRDIHIYSPSTIFRPQAVRVSGSYSAENQGRDLGKGASPFTEKKYNSNYNISFLALGTENSVSHCNAHPQSLGHTLKLFFKFTLFFGYFVMCVLFAPSVEC